MNPTQQYRAALNLVIAELKLDIIAFAQIANDPTNPAHGNLAAERVRWNQCILGHITEKMGNLLNQ